MTTEPLTPAGDDGAPPRRRRFRRVRALSERTPLRVKLVASVLALATIGLFLAGAAASTALRSYMVDRVDSQIGGARPPNPFIPDSETATATSGTVVLTPEQAGFISSFCSSRGPDRRGFGRVQYVQCNSLDGSTVTYHSSITDGTQPPQLPVWTQKKALAESAPFTVASKGGGAHWRVHAMVIGPEVILVASSLDEVEHTVSRLELDELVIGVTVLVLMAGFGYWIVRRSLRPLADVEHTAAAIAAGDLSRRVPHRDPRTEVGRLALSVNGMLSQIESAFRVRRDSEERALASEQRMRRFVTDASHELRTPLTSIRGFAELYRQGAAGNPDDLARLMRRIEDEAARMGLLVDDLLLLARLDQQRPLEREIVDLVVLGADAVHAAAAVAPDRDVTLEILPGPTPPEIIGDESRLRQVVGNLVTNALTHTPAGTPVTVRVGSRVESTGLYALVEVADEGPGLDEEASARVFERFFRAESSRNRSLGGTGLGLSIVAALVAAHAGRVELETAPGKGATFRVLLPAVPEPEPESDLGAADLDESLSSELAPPHDAAPAPTG
ncbi:HAMP domain-containing sensor histidine kinase [Acidothermaceae bacterium B102]|nr:HAMP domain-containing sensor histidine kinase [Acidothermaceae bacterium B102]